jgi:hypothetical protein
MKYHLYAAAAVIAAGVLFANQPSFAQTAAGAPAEAGGGNGQGGGHHHGQGGNNGQGHGEGHRACERILEECKRLGFIKGQWKKDNGLYKDCFDPIVQGTGNTTREGKPINVPVSQQEVEACREFKHHHPGHGGGQSGNQSGSQQAGGHGGAGGQGHTGH